MRRLAAWGTAAIFVGVMAFAIGCKGPDGKVLDKPHIVLIVLDTLRRDALSAYGYPAKVSPTFDEFAKKGLLFEDAISTAPWTLPSHASMFTGLLPSKNGCHDENFKLDSKQVTIAEQLSALGYQTVALYTNPWLNPYTGMDQGFRDYIWVVWPVGKDTTMKKGGEALLKRLVGWNVRRRDTSKPLFLFINLMETHPPFFPPEDYRRAVAGERGVKIKGEDSSLNRQMDHDFGVKKIPADEIKLQRLVYQGEVAYQDYILAKLLKTLERIAPKALIIITSDHGESFDEHGLVNHQFALYDELVRVPLAMQFDGCFANGTHVRTPVSLTDLNAMMLRVAKASSKCKKHIPMKELIPETRDPDRIRIAEYHRPLLIYRLSHRIDPKILSTMDRRLEAVMKGPLKLIADSRGAASLYDRSEDPGETRDLSPERPADIEFLRTKLGPWLPFSPFDPTTVKTDHISPEIQDQLKALGYVM